MGIIAKAERGRRTANLRGKSAVDELPRGNPLSPSEKKQRSEERTVGEHLTNKEIAEVAKTGGGWKAVVRGARAMRRESFLQRADWTTMGSQ